MNTKRPWWQWVLAAIAALLILGALFGGDDKQETATETKTATVLQPAPPTETTTTAEAAQTITDARTAVDDDDYAHAVAVAAALGASEEEAIRRRIANRLGRRALSAVRFGDRSSAGALLRQAGGYPRTQQLTLARASYRAAKDRAAARARTQRLAAAQRRRARREAQAAAAEQAQPETGSGCDPNYSGCVPAYPPDVNCPEVDGPVQVKGSDPHGLDRDNDGAACE
jgi:hypothetical protein